MFLRIARPKTACCKRGPTPTPLSVGRLHAFDPDTDILGLDNNIVVSTIGTDIEVFLSDVLINIITKQYEESGDVDNMIAKMKELSISIMNLIAPGIRSNDELMVSLVCSKRIVNVNVE